MKNFTVYKILLFLFIAFSPIQDSFLSKYGFGIFGASPSFIPLTLLILIDFIYKRSRKINLFFLGFSLYATVVLTINFIVYDGYQGSESDIIKLIKVCILYFYFFYPIFFLNYDKYFTRNALYIAFTISLFGLLASCIYPEFIDNNKWIHLTNQTNLRPRGFATESTTLSIQVMTLGFLCAIFSKQNFAKFIFLFSILISQILIESKGGIASISLAILISVLIFFRNSNKSNTSLLLISALIILLAYNFLFGFFIDDFNDYTSSATRLIMALSTFLIVESHPFGVGVSGYFQEISGSIPIAIKIINLPLNYMEVHTYINPDDYHNVSAKSLFLNGCIYLGIPFLIIYMYFFKNLFCKILRIKNLLLMILSIFSCMALTFYADGVGAYSLPIALGISLGIVRKNDPISSIQEN